MRQRTEPAGSPGTTGYAFSMAGRTAYRGEYQRDYGPDLDEPFDQTESGHAFLVPALQAARFDLEWPRD
jgi:hypothetical protein